MVHGFRSNDDWYASLRSKVVAALRLGAASPDDQVAYLLRVFSRVPGYEREENLVMDWIAENLEDARGYAATLDREGQPLPEAVVAALDDSLAALTGHGGEPGGFWYSEGLREAEDWAKVRDICRRALETLGVPD